MSTHDTNGREWAKISEVKAGSKIELDASFTCSEVNEHIVKDRDGLCFVCEHGYHYLDGQIDHEEGTHYVGVYLKEA